MTITEQVTLFSTREIEQMRQAGHAAASLLTFLEPGLTTGTTTLEINDLAAAWFQRNEAESALLGYRDFPKSICTSVNDAVCNTIPSDRAVLKDGDIIGLDIGLRLNGWCSNIARTYCIGTPSPKAKRLVETTEECLIQGINQVKPGARIGDLGAAIQNHAESEGFSVVRDFVGHGIGRAMHTTPQIPSYGQFGKGKRLRPGMVFTIEPMVNEGIHDVEVLADGWTPITKDRKLSAHFKHTVAVTNDGADILTTLSLLI